MSAQLEKIEQEALLLPKEEQMELIQRLTSHVYESPEYIHPAWPAEIERRVAKAKSEGAVGRSLEEILLEGLHSEAREMTGEDWEDIRRNLRARCAQRIKNEP